MTSLSVRWTPRRASHQQLHINKSKPDSNSASSTLNSFPPQSPSLCEITRFRRHRPHSHTKHTPEHHPVVLLALSLTPGQRSSLFPRRYLHSPAPLSDASTTLLAKGCSGSRGRRCFGLRHLDFLPISSGDEDSPN